MSNNTDQFLNYDYSVMVETIFDGDRLISFIYLKNTNIDERILRLSPQFPCEIINNTIVGINIENKFFYLNIHSGVLNLLDQVVGGFEYLGDRFIEVSGDKECLLLDTICSEVIFRTNKGHITMSKNIVKCISSTSTRIYDLESGQLLPTIPN